MIFINIYQIFIETILYIEYSMLNFSSVLLLDHDIETDHYLDYIHTYHRHIKITYFYIQKYQYFQYILLSIKIIIIYFILNKISLNNYLLVLGF